MTTLVCGSFTYDNTMVFRDHFKNHVLQDMGHLISVAFPFLEFLQALGDLLGILCMV